MTSYAIAALDETTWPAFAALVDRHGGVWGGCWCMAFHAEGAERGHGYDQKRQMKLGRVRAGTTHAALVFDGEVCVGWCQYGRTADLPRIKNLKSYRERLSDLPDWRITCFFIDKARRRRGVAAAALAGALRLIGQSGGGVVESYPKDTSAKRLSGAFLHNVSLDLFEAHGFTLDRVIGKGTCVVIRTIEAA